MCRPRSRHVRTRKFRAEFRTAANQRPQKLRDVSGGPWSAPGFWTADHLKLVPFQGAPVSPPTLQPCTSPFGRRAVFDPLAAARPSCLYIFIHSLCLHKDGEVKWLMH